jgi:hypothetical protein
MLISIYMRQCKLITFSCKGMNELKDLVLGSNLIETFDLSDCPYLITLNLGALINLLRK